MAIDAERLIELERKYGGVHRGARRINSPNDPRPTGSDRGGDRMEFQRYAAGYAHVLPDNPEVIVEMGIFKGTGLAMWCDLYPKAEIIGLDIDIDRCTNHTPELKKLGAFQGPPDQVRLLLFDETMEDSWMGLYSFMGFECVDVWVDDAIHDEHVIINAFECGKKFIKPGGVYIIEDNAYVADMLRQKYRTLDIQSWGEDNRLTTIRL